MTHKRPNNKLILASKALVLAAALVLVTGIALSLRQHKVDPEAPSPGNLNSPSVEVPPQDSFHKHHVEPDQPRYISIPAISVKAIVKPGGINVNNQVESPTNIHETSWYSGSGKPGQTGAMLINGHVSSWETSGVFYNLKLLQPGSEITIERGDGAKLKFTVVKTQTYDANNVDMEAALSPISHDKPGLNLITCAGEVIEGTNNFSKRIVVFAEQTANRDGF